MKDNTKVYAKHHEGGMAIYVERGGVSRLVMTHRANNRLFFYLCDGGKTLREMRGYRPGRNKGDQKFGRSLGHVVKVAEYVLNEAA